MTLFVSHSNGKLAGNTKFDTDVDYNGHLNCTYRNSNHNAKNPRADTVTVVIRCFTESL